MGKSFKISKSKLKKRPKKRGKYKEKPHDPKKPRTNDELEKVYPGYKMLNRLQRGIVELNLEDSEDCLDDEEGAAVTESFIPPNNWGRLMSNDKTTQLLFEERYGVRIA